MPGPAINVRFRGVKRAWLSPFQYADLSRYDTPWGGCVKRREFITLLGGVAAWPVVSHAQQPDRMRRIGVLLPLSGDDPEAKVRLNAFLSGLQENGWEEDRSIILDIRYGDGRTDRIRTEAANLIRSKPDCVLASGTQAASALKRTTREIPIVFVNVVDPVAGGLVTSLARPNENILVLLMSKL